MKFKVSEQEMKAARHPHELFLINLITNHILLFVGLLGMATSYPWLLAIVPVISVLVLGYLLLRARKSLSDDPWYAMCHWQVCARRSRLFLVMLGVMFAVIGLLLLVTGGDMKPQHYALGGVGILPTMLTVLVLIVMESDAVHQAKSGIVPRWALERFPNPEAEVLEE